MGDLLREENARSECAAPIFALRKRSIRKPGMCSLRVDSESNSVLNLAFQPLPSLRACATLPACETRPISFLVVPT